MKTDAPMRVEVRVSQRYDAPPARVFDAWIDPALAARWLFATESRPVERAAIDARAGGEFRFVERRRGAEIVHAGRYVEILPPRRLVFTLPADNSRVCVDIVALDAGCRLTLVQDNVPPEQAKYVEGRWSGMLYGLDKLLTDESTLLNG